MAKTAEMTLKAEAGQVVEYTDSAGTLHTITAFERDGAWIITPADDAEAAVLAGFGITHKYAGAPAKGD